MHLICLTVCPILLAPYGNLFLERFRKNNQICSLMVDWIILDIWSMFSILKHFLIKDYRCCIKVLFFFKTRIRMQKIWLVHIDHTDFLINNIFFFIKEFSIWCKLNLTHCTFSPYGLISIQQLLLCNTNEFFSMTILILIIFSISSRIFINHLQFFFFNLSSVIQHLFYKMHFYLQKWNKVLM